MKGDIPKAVLALVLVALALLTVRHALAADREGWFPTGAAIYIDVTRGNSGIYCHRDDGHVGHLGARVPIYRYGDHTLRTRIK